MKSLKLGQKVKALFNGEKVVEGVIYDMNDTTVWVENWEDNYPCKIETVEVIEPNKTANNKQKYEINEEIVVKYLQEDGYNFSLCANEDMTDIVIDGWSYIISVCATNKGFELSTVHKNRAKEESSNKIYIARFSTLVKKLDYFLNK